MSRLSFQENKALFMTEEGRRLLRPALFQPTEEKIRLLSQAWAAEDDILFFFALEDKTPVGLCVLRPNHRKAAILSLSVSPARQQKGVGRALIAHVRACIRLPLYAETDDDAVGFYQKCGFSITSLGEKYPGVIRYGCTLSKEE